MSLESKPDPMAPPPDARALVAIDLGAESCRVSLLRWIHAPAGGTVPHVEMVHRFPNEATEQGGELRWNIEQIWAGLDVGLRRCAELAKEGVASVAVDGWAVDYVRLDAEERLLGEPFCYRDARTVAAEESVHQRIAAERLYAITGIQRLRINTLYQLHADDLALRSQHGRETSAGRDTALWLNLPEYILFRLGGRPVAEYTNATHSAMVDITAKEWSREVFAAMGLDLRAAPRLVPPGTTVGRLQGPLAELAAYEDTLLIAPACHDTASAIAGIPAEGSDWAYISSGTWSLVGTLLDRACKSDAARAGNYSNLGAVGGGVCFHKNVNGMWLLRQCMEHWQQAGSDWTVPELVKAAEQTPAPSALLDLNDADLLLPGNMPAFINAQRRRVGLDALPEGGEAAPIYASLIFHSLAARYAEVMRDIAEITGKRLNKIYVVGGGSRNLLLNRLTEQATGLSVIAGGVESSTMGNFAVQLTVLEDAYDEVTGVQADKVARWARVLSKFGQDAAAASANPAAASANPAA